MDKFIRFNQGVNLAHRPEKFTFPFFYDPHPWAVQASHELQGYLESQTDFSHNFGLNLDAEGLVIGKMFGVLVCENNAGELGYLAAFSGKLANANHHKYFVPPVYDLLDQNGFFRKEEIEVNDITIAIEKLEKSEKLIHLKNELSDYQLSMNEALQNLKDQIKINKSKRKSIREKFVGKEEQFADVLKQLSQLSVVEQLGLKRLKNQIEEGENGMRKALDLELKKIEDLKLKRAAMSADIQRRIFDEYVFLNAHGEFKSLLKIFEEHTNDRPPAGAGECAAPKLLHYAYQYDLKPLCMAEFWWGAPPQSEIRKHKTYYPACRGKCEPILGHMLKGLEVDHNPLLSQEGGEYEISILFEDDQLIVVNKPAEFLSVPGKNMTDCLQLRLERLFPEDSPLLVHRLDMSTSGVILAAKNMTAHKMLQKQFIERTVEKRYVAMLDGVIKQPEGIIDLPLRVDLDDRPRQLVCYQHGKPAVTRYERISVESGKTRVYFYPETGRTHQLRVHAAHASGLGFPIIGDDLYGTKANRLHLHAEMLVFKHPVTREKIVIQAVVPF